MSRPRNPERYHNQIGTRVNDRTLEELHQLAERAGLTLSETVRWAVVAGLPIVREELAKKNQT